MAPRFSGLSAFPLTPMRDDAVDEEAFAGIVERLAASGVDSIGALGSTGSYAYLSRAERARVARLAVEHAAGVPVIVGVGALRTSQVLALVDDAEATGLNAGCETWYSVVGGTLPEVALAIVRAAQAGRGDDAQALADRLPRCGSCLRTTAACGSLPPSPRGWGLPLTAAFPCRCGA